MQIGLPVNKEPTKCSNCDRTADQVMVYFPTPVKDTPEEKQRVLKYALCEYCIFQVPYV